MTWSRNFDVLSLKSCSNGRGPFQEGELPSWAPFITSDEDVTKEPLPLLYNRKSCSFRSEFSAGIDATSSGGVYIEYLLPGTLLLRAILMDFICDINPVVPSHCLHAIQKEFLEYKQGRIWCLTQLGLYGLFPVDTQPGDSCAIFLGGKTPYVVRDSGSEVVHSGKSRPGLRCIGEWYVGPGHVLVSRHSY